MTFSLTREDYFSQNQILGFDYFTEIQEDLLGFKKGTTQFLEFDLDLLQEIVEIQRDILNEADKYKGTYLEDFDLNNEEIDYSEIEYSEFEFSESRGGWN